MPNADFSLARDYVAAFLVDLWFRGTKPHPVNAGLSNPYGDGALDMADQALAAADGTTALLHLEQAADMARAPTGFDESPHLLPHPATTQRHHMYLAARVALVLTREAMRQPKQEEPLVFTLEETQGDAAQGKAIDWVEPLELPEDFILKLETHPDPLCRHCGGFGWVPSTCGGGSKETCGFCNEATKGAAA